jgi:hypothetical protein
MPRRSERGNLGDGIRAGSTRFDPSILIGVIVQVLELVGAFVTASLVK